MEDIDFFLRLISVRSLSTTKEGYTEAASLIQDKLKSIGLTPVIYDGMEIFEDQLPRPNVVAKIDLGQTKTIMLNAHYDVVPAGEGWPQDPFTAIQVGDEIHARGASDDKSGIAAAVWAVEELGERAGRNILLAFTCDEEIGGAGGLGYLMNRVGLMADEALILDGGHDAVYIGGSGIIYGNIFAKGVQGHAGYPHRCKNPIYPLSKAVASLEEFGKMRERRLSKFRSPPGSPIPCVWGRFTITILKAGEKFNMIPGEAEATFDFRLLPEENREAAVLELEQIVSTISKEIGWEIELRQVEGGGSYYTDPEHPFVRGFVKSASRIIGRQLELAAGLGSYDGKYTRAKGIPTIVFGPSSPDSRDHGIDEFVRLKGMRIVKNILLHYMRNETI